MTNKKENMDSILKKLISQSEAVSNGDTIELSLDEQSTVDILDAIVSSVDIDRNICSNRSAHIKHSDRHVSDDYAMNIAGRLLLKAAGAKALGCSRQDIKCHDDEMQNFFEEHDLVQFKFNELMSDRAQQQHFGGQMHVVPIVRWRWNHGLIFHNYEGRVLTYLTEQVAPLKTLDINNDMQEALALYKMIDVLQSGFEMMITGDVPYSKLPPVMQNTMKEMQNNRLWLDREALSALRRNQKNN